MGSLSADDETVELDDHERSGELATSRGSLAGGSETLIVARSGPAGGWVLPMHRGELDDNELASALDERQLRPATAREGYRSQRGPAVVLPSAMGGKRLSRA